MKNTIKITIASFFALFSVLATTSSIAFAHGVDELFPRSAIANFCADKPLDSEHQVKMTLSDGNVVQGTIKCEAEYLNMSKNGADHNNDSKDHSNSGMGNGSGSMGNGSGMSNNNNDHNDDNKNHSNSGMSNDDNNDHDDDSKDHSNSGMGNGSGMGNN